MAALRNWKLSPSDLTFLWEECPRCFYLKVARDFLRPRPIMPKIFTVIDQQMKGYYGGKRAESISPSMPSGVVSYSERWVESRPISLPESTSTCFIKGKFDTVVQFDDGSYGVVDFKTSQRNSDHILLYSRQLHSYAYALENPAPGKLNLRPISRLGLLVFEPCNYHNSDGQGASLSGEITWLEIPRDEQGFLEFLAEVVAVLEQPEPPGGSPSCEWCQYRDISRRTAL